MNELILNDLEVASVSVVKQAARDFAAALVEMPQIQAFEDAALRFQQDEAAQQAMQAYRQKQQSLRMMLMLNAVSPQDQAELERLHQAWLAYDTVKAYAQAQAELLALCQALEELLSKQIGLNYSAACGASCCG
jgi:cell fate (sporulation/competence/biofilm development) regulator YlbF (YheA/YmcA/DUF963 family)